MFRGNSTRSSSTLAAARVGLSLNEISKAAGWSNVETFTKHYQKTAATKLWTYFTKTATKLNTYLPLAIYVNN